MQGPSRDETDIAIIRQLQTDGRRAYTSIAKDLGISEASVRQRVARLRRAKVIQIVALSNPLDLDMLSAHVHVRAEGARVQACAEEMAALPQVAYLCICAGSFDIVVRVVARDSNELTDVIVNHIRTIPGVVQVEVLLDLKVLKHGFDWLPGEAPWHSLA